ncbi:MULTISPECIES: DUF6641 family protein [unclassified Sphingomonas]|uniref:DUF6641 family protein n=1 Tax=unclassified Sphingomonas TaxID=196159 RepID=UPI002269BB3A|nr:MULTISPECIES: DUF6641 family protein [unclassified Sphingomonas]
MTLLSTLTFNAADPATVRIKGIVTMRQKLIDRIDDQISLAEARQAGQSFQRIKYRRSRDLENDQVSENAIPTRVRPWWMEDKDGSILLWIKYGNHVLELQKGKAAIRVKTRDNLVSTLATVRDAVRAGELDTVILAAVASFKTRFSKPE